MKIDEEIVTYLEDLSCLNLSNNEKKQLMGDLEKILNSMEQLSELDTDDVLECSHPFDNVNAFREDKTEDSFDLELILKNAPCKNYGMLIAPRIKES